MAFQDDARKLLVRGHLSDIPKPVVYGAALLLILVLVFVAMHFAGVFGRPLAIVEAQENADPGNGLVEEAPQGELPEMNEPAVVVVHVAGAVENPGVYPVSEGSRVQAAVKAAGGFSSQACPEAVNLARIVADGEQIYIPTVEEVEAGSAPAAGSAASGPNTGQPAKVNINTADASGLDSLPGVGPATAQRIIADREANGPFSSPEDIMRVSGIGQKKFEQMASMIAV